MDKEYSRQRDIKKQRKAKHVGEGLLFGFRDLLQGTFEGVTGIVTQPVKGAIEGGVEGFFKGVGRGLVGVVAKPTVGAIDLVTRTTEGIKNTTTLLDEKKERKRYPRTFGNDFRIIQYDAQKSEGQNILFTIQNGRFQDEKYVHHEYNKKLRCVLISDKTLFYLHDQDLLVSYRWEPNWRCPFSRLQLEKYTNDTIEFKMYDINWVETKKKIQFDDQKKLEQVVYILKPRLSTDIGKEDIKDGTKKNLDAPIKEGYLIKSGAPPITSWKRRWFVLEKGEIKYYNDTKNQPQGTIPVNGSKIVQVEIQKKKHVFSIVTKSRTYHIQAESEYEKQSWIAACIEHGGTYSD